MCSVDCKAQDCVWLMPPCLCAAVLRYQRRSCQRAALPPTARTNNSSCTPPPLMCQPQLALHGAQRSFGANPGERTPLQLASTPVAQPGPPGALLRYRMTLLSRHMAAPSRRCNRSAAQPAAAAQGAGLVLQTPWMLPPSVQLDAGLDPAWGGGPPTTKRAPPPHHRG